MFDPLSHDQLRKVARLQMKDVAARLAERGVAIAISDAALDVVLAQSYDPVSNSEKSVCLCCAVWLIMEMLILHYLQFRFMVLAQFEGGWRRM